VACRSPDRLLLPGLCGEGKGLRRSQVGDSDKAVWHSQLRSSAATGIDISFVPRLKLKRKYIPEGDEDGARATRKEFQQT